MKQQKQFRENLDNKLIILGLSSVAVLLAVADAGVTSLSSFPNKRTSLGGVMRRLNRRNSKSVGEYLEMLKEVSGFNLRVILHRLEKKGLIRRHTDKYEPTNSGRELSRRFKRKINHFAHWDGKWRLISFDIPESRRRDRDWLRGVLEVWGFERFHKSVFVGKFPLPDSVFKEIYQRGLMKCVRLLTIGETSEDLSQVS